MREVVITVECKVSYSAKISTDKSEAELKELVKENPYAGNLESVLQAELVEQTQTNEYAITDCEIKEV